MSTWVLNVFHLPNHSDQLKFDFVLLLDDGLHRSDLELVNFPEDRVLVQRVFIIRISQKMEIHFLAGRELLVFVCLDG